MGYQIHRCPLPVPYACELCVELCAFENHLCENLLDWLDELPNNGLCHWHYGLPSQSNRSVINYGVCYCANRVHEFENMGNYLVCTDKCRTAQASIPVSSVWRWQLTRYSCAAASVPRAEILDCETMTWTMPIVDHTVPSRVQQLLQPDSCRAIGFVAFDVCIVHILAVRPSHNCTIESDNDRAITVPLVEWPTWLMVILYSLWSLCSKESG